MISHHRAALEYDFAVRFGHGVDGYVNGARPWNLGAMYADGLLKDPYSHVTASVAGYSFVPNPSDVAFLNWVDATAMMNHRAGKVKPTPVVRPWEVTTRARPVAAPDPRRRARRAALNARLGLTSP